MKYNSMLHAAIREAFEISTQKTNSFEPELKRAPWDSVFFTDDEWHFCGDGFIFTTPSLEPFEITREWWPSFTVWNERGVETIDM